MKLGDVVFVPALNRYARVLAVIANQVDLQVDGWTRPVRMWRTSIRWAGARDRGATGAGKALGTAVVLALVVLLLTLAHRLPHTDVTPVPSPTQSVDFDHDQRYAILPDCSWHTQPCVSDDETPGALALHLFEAVPVPFAPNGAPFTDTDGHVWHAGVILGGWVVASCAHEAHTCFPLSRSWDGVQRYWRAV